MASSKTFFVDKLYNNVKTSLNKQDILKEYKTVLDKYLAVNSDKYMVIGPGERPIFNTNMINKYIEMTGLTNEIVNNTLKESKSINSSWYIMNNPFNIANALATYHFIQKNNKEYIKFTQWYLLISFYPSLHFKYFKYGVNDACMNYTINNLSGKYNIKGSGSLWGTLTSMIENAFKHHESKLKTGEDKAFIDYIQDVHTRMNSLMRNISRQYYDNHENEKYLKTEKDSFDDETYYEADSNSYIIERLSNKVVTHMVVNGPDMQLVKLASKTNNVSVNEMRNYTNALINEKHRSEIHDIVESLLYIFLNATDAHYTVRDIGTNEFMIYCLKAFKKSNTIDPNIVRIKSVLDKWIDDVGISKTYKRPATVSQFKRALYTFFVMSIQKIAG